MIKQTVLVLLLCASIQAQNNAVLLYQDMPTNSLERVLGVPLQYPAVRQQIGNSTNVAPPWRLMSDAQFILQKASHQVAFDTWKPTLIATQELNNLNDENRRQQNIQALKALFDAFKAYEQFVQTNTPSNAQVLLEVRRLNGAMLRLEPMLRDLYRGED